MKKAIVIGSGFSGCMFAMMLREKNWDVTVIEKESEVGGRSKLVHKDGFTYDRGPTFFHFPEVIEEIFQAVGLDAHEELELIPLTDPSYRLVFGAGGQIDATSNLDLMTERIRELSGDKNARGFEKQTTENIQVLYRFKLNTYQIVHET